MNIKQASLTIASIGLLPFGPLVAQEEILVDALIGIGPKGKGKGKRKRQRQRTSRGSLD